MAPESILRHAVDWLPFRKTIQFLPVAKAIQLNKESKVSLRIPGRLLWTLLALHKRIWPRLPASLRFGACGRAYGRHIHRMVQRIAIRNQSHGTFFLRNRPELELMCRLQDQKPSGSSLRLAIVACSKGAEVYSMLWAIRSTRPDLKISTTAIDISREILEFAERGEYTLDDARYLKERSPGSVPKIIEATWKDQPVSIFERMTREEMEAMFEIEGSHAKIRPWLKEGVTWFAGDASDPGLVRVLGPQDIVVANRFLCHMAPEAAEKCLRNIVRLVKPGGFLFVTGVDLDIRAKVASALGWNPVPDLLKEIHEGDSSLKDGWPLNYWGLEPFRHDLPDWKMRYTAVFQIGQAPFKGQALTPMVAALQG
jgi:chemotaxis methyl-accepting protein methylase